MISVEKAREIITAQKLVTHNKKVKLEDALGYYLAQDIIADRDFPPYDRVAMDGIAIRYEEYSKGKNEFSIVGVQLAGQKPIETMDSHECIEIMTGAMLPKDFDTVIRYEEIEIENNKARLLDHVFVKQGQNIHRKGTDAPKETVVANQYQKINTAIIGAAATVGLDEITVIDQPRIAIISTGDELVDIKDSPAPYQIRRSNVKTIGSSLKGINMVADEYHIEDERNAMLDKVQHLIEKYDMLIFSGGVSKGKADFLPEVLNTLGVKKLFHRIAQKPGKPLWFGTLDSKKVIFGLPGNPVSSSVCMTIYVVPFLLNLITNENETKNYQVTIAEDIEINSSLTNFVQVHILNSLGRNTAFPIRGNGSGDLIQMVKSSGIVEIDPKTSKLASGSILKFYPWT